MPSNTELDALLSRVQEMQGNPAYPDRNAVAYDCYRMFEDLATRYKEEFKMRDYYKARANSWMQTALRHADYKGIAEDIVGWLSDQTYQGEALLHAIVCCDFVSRNRFVESIAKRVEQFARKDELGRSEFSCPCCDNGQTPSGICQECHGQALVSVAYDTLRMRYKRLAEAALKLPRPWIDGALSYSEWDAAFTEIEKALK